MTSEMVNERIKLNIGISCFLCCDLILYDYSKNKKRASAAAFRGLLLFPFPFTAVPETGCMMNQVEAPLCALPFL